MKRCKRCQLEIIDHTDICPLCRSVLESDEKNSDLRNDINSESSDINSESSDINSESSHIKRLNGDMIKDIQRYPKSIFKSSRYYLLNKIVLFLSVVIIITSVAVNYFVYPKILWSIVSIAAVVYSWTIIRHAVVTGIDLASKIIVQAISASVLLIIFDLTIGNIGWSVNYIVPQIAIIANISIFILLIISRMDWKRYVLHQMGMGLLGFIPIILLAFRLVERPLMSLISAILSGIIILFTVVFSDRTLQSELIRRFHI